MRLFWRRPPLAYAEDDEPSCDLPDTTETFTCDLPQGHKGPHSDLALTSALNRFDWPAHIFSDKRVHLDRDLAGSYWLVYDSPDGKWCTQPLTPNASQTLRAAMMHSEGENQ